MKIEWEQRVRVAESAPLSLVAACCQTAEGVRCRWRRMWW